MIHIHLSTCQGGFARCWELIDNETNVKYAGKVVSKGDLVKQSQKQKMQQEISIHSTLKHENIVGFHRYFEDTDNIYILLELCPRRTLMELHKRRKYVTEPEARYFLRQIIHGCQYLHRHRIMHRDLKLANLFLNDEMVIKIGDFGLASRIAKEGEKKKTLCGTPNYIAPEILAKRGHSYEVDCWSLGCIVYTLLVGRPPFETSNLKDTYERIQKNEYQIPMGISAPASKFIRALLHADPTRRPSMFTMLDDEFFKGYIPNCLPCSALSTCPRFDNLSNPISGRKPLTTINAEMGDMSAVNANNINKEVHSDDCWLGNLKSKIADLLSSPKTLKEANLEAMEESEDPACAPIYWICKWVDYSDRYGIGYHLCDDSNGVLFNDATRLLLTSNEQNLQYIENDGKEHLFTIREYPESISKKVTLLTCFTSYMRDHLLNAGENITRREADAMSRVPFLRTWFRTQCAIVLHLSNGTLQINFFDDHSKIILCPLMEAVTYIDTKRDFKTFRFTLLHENGVTADLVSRLQYAVSMIDRLRRGFGSGSRVKSTTSTTKSAASSEPTKGAQQSVTATTDAAREAVFAGAAASAKGLAAVDTIRNRP